MQLGFGEEQKYTYIKIENGKITVQAKEGDPKAKSRTIEKGQNKGKVVWFKEYPSFTGIIQSVKLRQSPWSKFDKLISITFKGAYCLDIPVDSPYGNSFAMRCQNIDLDKPVKFAPYKIEREDKPGKFNQGVVLYQESGKVEPSLNWKEHVPSMVKLNRPINGSEWDKSDQIKFFEDHLSRWIEDNNLAQGNSFSAFGSEEGEGLNEDPDHQEENNEIPF